MWKSKNSWRVGSITVLVITAAWVFIVVSPDTFNKLVTVNDCDRIFVCQFLLWREPANQRPYSVTISTADAPSWETGSYHPKLDERDVDDVSLGNIASIVGDNELATEYPPAKNEIAQNEDQVHEDNEMQMDIQEEENRPTQEDEQTQDNYMEGLSHQEKLTEETIDADTESDDIGLLHACLLNGDCGLGYMCFKGQCRPGCSKHLDCPNGYECRYGRYGYRCFEKKGWHRECKVHLRFCWRHHQCCSGYCGRKSKGKSLMCRRPPEGAQVETGEGDWLVDDSARSE